MDIYRVGLKELIIEIMLYFIFIIICFLGFYINFLIGIYLLFILFFMFKKSNKVIAINNNKMYVLRYFIFKQNVNVENIKKIYCKQTRLRFTSFTDVCVIFTNNDKYCEAHFISYNFFGYTNILEYLNSQNNRIIMDVNSFKLINVFFEENKFIHYEK